jgi:hypothetical protein
MAKHFLKTLIIFVGMIIIGLVGVFIVGSFDEKRESTKVKNNEAEVAK